MPELPEVESTVRSMERELSGRIIERCTATWPRMIEPYSSSQLSKKLSGRTVGSITRRGKLIIVEVRDERDTQFLLLHLRMSGRIRVIEAGERAGAHDRITLTFTDGSECRFVDPRKFGRFTLMDGDTLEKRLSVLGPEPLSSDFSSEQFFELLATRRRMLKPLLLDQNFLAGLGNIYVDESLWAAKLHPLREADTLTRAEVNALYRHIRRILRKAIEMNGTDFGDGVVYNGQFSPKVYGRDGEPCKRCRSALHRLVVAQRGTVVCNYCQGSDGKAS